MTLTKFQEKLEFEIFEVRKDAGVKTAIGQNL